MSSSSSSPNETDHRLRYWLDTNQQDRERLCLALLSLDSRFRNITPRHPQGGPDGGRDIEATMDDGRKVWIAVGFKNNTSDSSADVRSVRSKFSSDLERALKENSALEAFVFMTNVRLTTGAIGNLVKQARARGIAFCEVLTRERLRILLDGPDGLGIRFQYLRIPLSDAEQAAFFARWGTQFEKLVAQKFSAVDSQLARLEFLHDCQRPLRSIAIHVELNAPASLDELGHYRVLLTVWKLGGSSKYSSLLVGARDHDLRPTERPIRNDVVSGGFWISKAEDEDPTEESKSAPSQDEPNRIGRRRMARSYSTSSSLADGPMKILGASGGFSSMLDEAFPAPTLGDLDENFLAVFVTQPLLSRIRRVDVFANGYVLRSITADNILPEIRTDGSFDELWPEQLSVDEMSIPWARLDSRDGSMQVSFSYRTPHKRWRALADERSLPD
ncbi:hypothetical protein [Gemmatimonas aurantiaca]|uniref:hypothetical protein n=1 Tax=Gemmatimonas aurantiaca TaxID=173480 RepID=UPI00301E0208